MGLEKSEVTIRIESYAVNDPYGRYHALGIDQEIDSRFWITQPEKVIGVSAGTFVYERPYSLSPFVKHMVVYVPSSKPGLYWSSKIFANRILIAQGKAANNMHLVGSFRIIAGRVVPAILKMP